MSESEQNIPIEMISNQPQAEETIHESEAKAFSECETLEELIKAIQARGEVQGSQRSFTAEELIQLIDDINHFRKPINVVPRTDGLRDVVHKIIFQRNSDRRIEEIKDDRPKSRLNSVRRIEEIKDN